MIYDKDRSGTLEPSELANFFNEVFQKMNESNHVDERDVQTAMRNLDQDFNNKADKQEIFNVLKKMMNTSASAKQAQSQNNSSNIYNQNP